MFHPAWISIILGLWLIAAPFVLNYVDVRNAMLNDVAVGLVVALVALWTGLVTRSPSPK
ncbi:MAG: SPW repeat protein [Chloroflexi bacterium]|nr:SPW repeat protein [Chloroflexota bacterium]